MSMSSRTRTGLVAAAAAGTLAIAALAGTTVANAAVSGGPSASQPATPDQGQATGQQRPVEEALTGDTATKVRAAVEAKYPGATIDRMEKDGDGASVYEAHITKTDGTHVTVMLDANYAITGEQAGGPGGPGGKGDRGRHGQAGSQHDATGTTSPTNAA